jgi:hypothetical protein
VPDALGAYIEHLKTQARATYEYELALYNQRACLVTSPGRPPEIPQILQPSRR